MSWRRRERNKEAKTGEQVSFLLVKKTYPHASLYGRSGKKVSHVTKIKVISVIFPVIFCA